jgi:ABC-type Mn2+/Zn2+ transport system ATPase subunit
LRLHTGTSFSLNFYDELFDSAIDDNGIEKIIDILKNKVEKYEESVYIISHKNHTKVNVDHVLLLEKSKGITSLIS